MTRKDPAGDYVVGYGRPPVQHQWKKGESGNSRGRKKKAASVGDTLKAKLRARIVVGESGRRRTMSMQDLILEQLIRDAAKGEPRARVLLFSLIDRYEGTNDIAIDPALLSGEDQRLIDDFLARATQSEETGSQEESTSACFVNSRNREDG